MLKEIINEINNIKHNFEIAEKRISEQKDKL